MGDPVTYSKHARKIGDTTVGWMAIEVWFDPSFAEQNLAGYWDPEKLRITLGPDSTKGAETATIIHELIHATAELFNLRLSEETVRKLEVGVVQGWQQLKLNRKIIARLARKLKAKAG